MIWRAQPILNETVGVAASVHGKAGFSDPWSAKSFRELLALPGTAGVFAIAESSDIPAGLVLWRAAAGEGEILTIGVTREQRRQGAGRFLVAQAVAAMQESAVRTVFLEVAVDNVAAIELYGEFGFRSSGLRRGYYRTTLGPIDASILAKELS